jgi:hypothetical protein
MSAVRLAVLAAAVLAAAGIYAGWRHAVYQAGQDSVRAEITAHDKERTDAANRADDAAGRCARDPDCRMQDDGFRRD